MCDTNTIAVLTFLGFLHCCEKKLERPNVDVGAFDSVDRFGHGSPGLETGPSLSR